MHGLGHAVIVVDHVDIFMVDSGGANITVYLSLPKADTIAFSLLAHFWSSEVVLCREKSCSILTES